MSEGRFSKMVTSIRKQSTRFHYSRKASSSAFTLIELLVVIAIIALLLSIITPALKAVKKQAQATVGATNLKQWALCYKLYTQDYNDEFPPFGGVNVTYMESLRYYYDDIEKIRTCPAATKVSPDNPTGLQPLSFFGDTFYAWQVDSVVADWMDDDDWGIGSYTENTFIRNVNDDRHWRKITSIRNTSKVPMIGDGKWNNALPDHNNPLPVAGIPPADYDINNWAQIYCYVMNRHKKGINIAFADMTVRYTEAEDLWNLKWQRDYETRTDIDLSNME